MLLRFVKPMEALLKKAGRLAREAEQITPRKPKGPLPKELDEKAREVLREAQAHWDAGKAMDRKQLAERHGLSKKRMNYLISYLIKRGELRKPPNGLKFKREEPKQDASEVSALVGENTRLVTFWLNRLGLNKSKTRDELHQAGMTALARAAALWDKTKGVKFGTYASVAIIRAVCTLAGTQKKPEISYADHLQKGGKSAEEEVIESEDASEKITEALGLIQELRKTGKLKERDALVFLMRKLHKTPLLAIGKHPQFNVTRERIRKIEARATRKIQEAATRVLELRKAA